MLPMHTSRLVSYLVEDQHDKTSLVIFVWKIDHKILLRISYKLHLHDHQFVSDRDENKLNIFI